MLPKSLRGIVSALAKFVSLARSRYLLFVFIFIYFVLCLLLYKDFGATFDEKDSYQWGEAYFNHYLNKPNVYNVNILKGQPGQYSNIYTGALFGISRLVLGVSSIENYHLLNLIFIIPIFIVAFELLLHRYKKQYFAIWGPIFLFLLPRFIGDSPGNPKDMPMAVVYFVSLGGIFYFSKYRNTVAKTLILGVLFGITQQLRAVGYSIYGVFIIFEIYKYWISDQSKTIKDNMRFFVGLMKETLFIIMTAMLFMLITWPYVGSNLFAHFIYVLVLSKSFPWNGMILFKGHFIESIHLPISYLPTWFVITTPIFIMVLFLLSFFILKKKSHNPQFFLMLTALTLNTFLFLCLKPIVYDGLRHYLFLLPILGFVAAMTFIEILCGLNFKELFLKKKIQILRICFVFFVVINMSLVLISNIKLHPYQYIYFNELMGGLKGAYLKFETDYWGASYKEAVSWLISNEIIDKNKSYFIFTRGNSYQSAIYFKKNMIWTDDFDKVNYIISYTRGNDNTKVIEENNLRNKAQIIHIVERQGVPLNFIYKIIK